MSYVCESESLCQPTVDISCTPLPIGCLGRFGETGGDMLKDMLDWTGSLVFCQVELSKGDHFSVNIDNIMDTKRAHVGKSAFDRSNTVPVSESYLAPHALQSHLCDPAADRPSPQRGHPGAGLNASAASSKVPHPCASRQALALTAADRSAKPAGAERGDARGGGKLSPVWSTGRFV